MGQTEKRYLAKFFQPIDQASLALFRFFFGVIIAIECFRFWNNGWIEKYFVKPQLYFPYEGFEWISPWSSEGMQVHFAVLLLSSILFAVGLFYRLASILLFLGFTFVFLIDKTNYLNHFYFICLLCFLCMFIRLDRYASLAAFLQARKCQNDAVAGQSQGPLWELFLLRAQIGLVYFFGGIAKINGDWLQAKPIDQWLSHRTDFPFVGWMFDETWIHYFFAYSGLLIDLLIVPALLWKRTRAIAFLFVLCFHLMNARLFDIGIFPWLMIAATTMFWTPSWPRQAIQKVYDFLDDAKSVATKTPRNNGMNGWIPALVTIFLTIQFAIPLRHHLYPGNVSWTEEGHRFAWHMMLRKKKATIDFYVTKADGRVLERVYLKDYLSQRQIRKMKKRPDMILQFAKMYEPIALAKGYRDFEIRVNSRISLNGRAHQHIIDPQTNLLDHEWGILPADWLLPLSEEGAKNAALAD